MAKRFHNSIEYSLEALQPTIKTIEDILAGFPHEIGGSIKRGKTEGINDLDFLVLIEDEIDRKHIRQLFRQNRMVLITSRDYMDAFVIMLDRKPFVIDVFYTKKETWGNAQLFVTGSKHFNDYIRHILSIKEMSWADIRFFQSNDESEKVFFDNEKDAMAFVGLGWHEPTSRNGGDIIYNTSGKYIKRL